MAVRTEELQLRVLVDGSPAKKELAELDQEYAQLNASMKDLTKGSKEWVAAQERVGQIGARQAELRKEIGMTGLTAKQLGDELRRLQVAQRNLTPNTPMWAENAQRIEQLKGRLRELNDVNARAQAAWEQQRQGIKLTNMSMMELQMESRRLRTRLETLDPTTPLFARTKREIDQVDARLKSVAGGGMMGGLKNALSSSAASLIGWTAAIGGAVQGARTLIRWSAELSDRQADVRKTTGMTAQEVEALTSKLNQMDTRTSQEQLLALARDAGKLGIAKEEVLGFVRASDQINVALGEDLGEGATKTIGKLSEQFKVTKREGFDLERSMLGVGSALNELGASSTADEAFLVDYTSRMAGVNTQAGISIENTLGFASALDQLGQRTETSSTAIGQFTLKAFSKTSEYAKIAGMDVKAFTDLLNSDANEALLRTLQGLNGNNEGLGRMTELFSDLGQEGARAVGVLASLAQNTDMVRTAQGIANQALRDGTSVTNEFNTKNSTLAAELDKLSNTWRNTVTEITQGSGVISRALMGITMAAKDVLGYFAELNREGDALGRNIGSGKGSGMRNDASISAYREQVNAYLDADKRLYKSGATDALVSRYRDQLRVMLETRGQTLEGALAIHAAIQEKLDEAPAGSVKRAMLLTQLNMTTEALAKLRMESEASRAPVTEVVEPKPTGGTGTGGDGDDAAKKKVEAQRTAMEKLRQDLIAAREQMLVDAMSADGRELEQVARKYDEIRSAMLATGQATTDDLLAVEAARDAALLQKLDEQGEKRAAKAREQALREQQERIKAEDEAYLDSQLNEADKEIVREMEKMDAMVAIYEKAGIDTQQVVQRTEAGIAAIREKYRKAEESKALDERKRRITEQVQIYQGVASAIGGVNALLAAAYDASGKANYEKTKGAKVLGLAQIAIASGVGVAEAIKSGAGAGGFPANLAAIATGVGAVLTGIASAVNLLKAAKIDQPASSAPASQLQARATAMPYAAKGGIFDGPSHDDDGLNVVDPRDGRVVAEVEGGEPWMVLSKAFRANNGHLLPLLMQASADGTPLRIVHRKEVSDRGIFAPVPAFNFERADKVLEMASGGIVNRGQASAAEVAPERPPQTLAPSAEQTMAPGMAELLATTQAALATNQAMLAELQRERQAYVVLQDLERKRVEWKEVQNLNRVKKVA